jgi:hypothetical protein
VEMEGSGPQGINALWAQASSASPGLAAARTLEPGEQALLASPGPQAARTLEPGEQALLASPGPQAARTLGNYIQESNHTSYTSGKSPPKTV